MTTPLIIASQGYLADEGGGGGGPLEYMLDPRAVQAGIPTASTPSISDGTTQPSEQPFYFAWVNSTDGTFNSTFERADEQVFSFQLNQNEGEFAELFVDVINPKTGLLAAGRKQWVWFSYYNGSSAVPLFFGRLVGVPQQLQNEIVRLQFIARPGDYEPQKEALADTLKVAPFWEPLFLTEESIEDPDAVLEARPALWHIDPITHVVSISDITQGEAGTIAYGGNYYYDSLNVSYSTPPASRCIVDAEISWAQRAAGEIDVTDQMRPFKSHTGPGVYNDWPDEGTSFGSVFSVASTDPGSVDALVYYEETENGLPLEIGFASKFPVYAAQDQYQTTSLWYEWSFDPSMTVAYNLTRDYIERVSVTLACDTQAMVTDPGDTDTIRLSVAGRADEVVVEAGSGSGPASAGATARRVATRWCSSPPMRALRRSS